MIGSIKIVDDDLQYGGSRMFMWLAELCGLSLDLINFLITQICCLLLASLFRSLLHPSKVSSGVRHAVGLTIGLFFGHFCFGQQAIHIAGLPALCYVVIRTQNPQVVQRMVLVVALLYLSCVHLHRLYYDYGSPTIDITGALMIITQKVTTLAFSIHDGLCRDDEELTKSQRYHAVRKIPSVLEYFAYCLHFQGLLAGPMVLYKDYVEFIEGYNILKHSPSTNGDLDTHLMGKRIVLEPSPIKAVVKKVVGSLICAFIYMKFSTTYPIKSIKDSDFMDSTNVVTKFWFIMMSTTVVRFKYYHAWLLADAICNNSGLGFNGYDADGNAKWDMITNINVISFELATNFRDAINNWNIGTNLWLRNIVYERVPKRYGTVLTFSLSALWHGFYPGYYITFATGAIVVMAARISRKLFRHYFQTNATTRTSYDILTMLITRLSMGYTTFPFVLLEFHASLRMYLNLFMCLHLVSAITIICLPRLLRANRQSIAPTKSTTSTTNTETIQSTFIPTNDDQPMVSDVCDTNILCNTPNGIDVKPVVRVRRPVMPNSMNGNGGAVPALHKNNLSFRIREKFDNETRNIENFIDNAVTGIVELKDDLMKMQQSGNGTIGDRYNVPDGLKKRKTNGCTLPTDGYNSRKHEIGDALSQANNNVLPAVISNGQAK